MLDHAGHVLARDAGHVQMAADALEAVFGE
jgi:hypothetical protein